MISLVIQLALGKILTLEIAKESIACFEDLAIFSSFFLRESSTRAISGMEKNEIGNDPTSCSELHLVMCVEHTTYSQLCVRDFELNTPVRQAA